VLFRVFRGSCFSAGQKTIHESTQNITNHANEIGNRQSKIGDVMKPLDLIIIFGYLIGIVVFGTWFGRKQETTKDYFLGDRSVPWWAVAFSIVATETSTITFISVPGIAFARGGNFQFLQLVFGYLLGRVVISLLFIPSYFRGELMTVYQLLDRRFGGKI
jgi:Na+/proline symporter